MDYTCLKPIQKEIQKENVHLKNEVDRFLEMRYKGNFVNLSYQGKKTDNVVSDFVPICSYLICNLPFEC